MAKYFLKWLAIYKSVWPFYLRMYTTSKCRIIDPSPHKWSGPKWSRGTIYDNRSGPAIAINGPPRPLMPKHKWSY